MDSNSNRGVSLSNVFRPYKPQVKEKEFATIYYDILLHESGKAYLFIVGGEEFWFPKSMCEVIDDRCNWLQLPYWLVKKNNLTVFDVDKED